MAIATSSTLNKVRLKDLILGSSAVSDTAFGAGWNGVTTIAPSKNAVYDKLEFVSPDAVNVFVSATAPTPLRVHDLWIQI
jgi:hypothetical protein